MNTPRIEPTLVIDFVHARGAADRDRVRGLARAANTGFGFHQYTDHLATCH